ncbi:MAG: LuxR C-terminal-related transcriptional regulator [Candidatus Nanopelagicales bacterium]
MLSAPPGYGRRTLVEEATAGQAVVVELPAEDLDLAGWRRLVARATGVRAEAEDLADLLPQKAPWLAVLDLDPARHGPAVADLRSWSPHGPAGQRIAITTTENLGRDFSQVRLAGRLVELNADSLAFDGDESLALLRALAPALEPALAVEVARLCDGWAAALVETARFHGLHPDADLLGWLRTHGADRLLGPWLDVQPAAVREMLLDTAVLDRLEPGLVDAVTQASTGSLLAMVATPGGPVRAAPTAEGAWFDRHPLLTCLVRYLASGRPGEQARHRRAADWFRDHGDPADELAHRLFAGDADQVADRFHAVESELMATGRAPLALQWYETLPDRRQAAENLLREGWAFALSGRIPEAEASLDRLRSSFDGWTPPSATTHPPMLSLDAETQTLRAWLAEYRGDLPRMVDAATRARELFGEAWSTSTATQVAVLVLARGLALQGDLNAARDLLASVRDSPFTLAVSEGRRAATEAMLAWQWGDVHEARVWAARHDRWVRGQDPGRAGRRFQSGVTGLLCLAESGQPREAARGVVAAASRAEGGSLTDLVLARVAAADVLESVLEVEAALRQVALARAAVLDRAPRGGLLPVLALTEARLRLTSGDGVRAARAIPVLPAGVPRRLLHARLALLRNTPGAVALVRDIEPSTPRQQVEHELLGAMAYQKGSRQRAEQHLVRAADIADRRGLTRYLVTCPDDLVEFARRVGTHYVHDPLLAAVDVAYQARAAHGERRSPSRPATTESAPAPVGVSLTRGDLQLLTLLPTRAGNRELGDQLGVSVNTIKTRLRRLYAKLGVHDRDEAVARATKLGLIPRS